MQHGGKLDTQLATGMNADAALKFLADQPCHPSLAQASPESCVQENHVDGISSDTGSELLKIRHHGVGRSRNFHELADAPHAFESPTRVFVIVVTDVLDCATNANGFFDTPRGIGIEAK